jgi:exosortase K
MTNVRNRKLVPALIALGLAAGLKAFYSTASVNDLRWILAPTTLLVEIVTGESFRFEAYTGYMNSDHSFLIADSCSGVNFLIAAFLMLALMSLWNGEGRRQGWAALPFSIFVAYIATIAANTVRIALAMKLHRMDGPSIWVNPEQLHRFQGIFIYFGFLMLLFVLFDRVRREDSRKSLLRYLIPLAVYWLITLGVPLLNGAYGRGVDLHEHFLFVVVTPVLILVPLLAVEAFRRARANSML